MLLKLHFIILNNIIVTQIKIFPNYKTKFNPSH